jgi:hypothetical protein
MQESTMNQIVAAGEASDLIVLPYSGYSGRGMYGGKTCAIIASGFAAFVAAACEAVRLSADPDEIVEEMRGLRTDSLGRDVVLY